jgi:competence protein ComEC
MPAAVLGILAYPFALDLPVWWLMGQAVRGMLAISGWIEGFGGATLVVPAFGAGALGLLAAALLLATLPASGLRWLALLPGACGLALAAVPERHDLYVDRQGGGAAFRAADGRLVTLGRPSGFVVEQWLKADGDGRKPADLAGGTCDRLGCTGRLADGRAVALVRDRRAFAEDCARAAVIVTALRAPPGCAAALVIDRAYLARHGATAVRVTADGALAARHARDPTRAAPWQPVARPPPEPQKAPRPEIAEPAPDESPGPPDEPDP